MTEKGQIIELLHPFLRAAPPMWLESMEEYNTLLRDDFKLSLGDRHRAEFLRDRALWRAKTSPEVAADFVAVEDNQLHALVLDGENGSPNLSILFNKVRQFKGQYRTGCRATGRSRRSGQLVFEGLQTIPLVCFYELAKPVDRLRPSICRIGIGYELESGFDWMHTIWTDEGGMSTDVIMPQLPLMPQPSIKLRKPKVAADTPRVRASDRTASKTDRRETGKSTGTGEGA